MYLAEPDFRGTVFSTVVPFRNSTVPVGVPEDEETVAVKVIDFPYGEGLREEISVVVLKGATVYIREELV
jgi:hypothetical protein